ncbi:MAG: hypothetical protein ACI8WB_002780 [Phenylobacterium sp.]|jgi:hypothetical protein
MKNPFRYDNFATGSSFCGRHNEIATMKQLCGDGKNILLYSRRRYGKSSLIQQLFGHHFDQTQFITIYVDLFEILTANDFAKLFYQASAKSMKLSLKTASQQLVKYFKKVHFGINIDQSGNPAFSPTLASRDFDELIEDTFNGLVQYAADHNIKVVVAFDEFQQISDIKEKKIDAVIRKYIQHHDISYIFCGSKKHLLTGLFTHHSKPLFSMATGIELNAIEPDVFFQFANHHLTGHLSRTAFDYLFEQVDGESKLLQQACYHFFYLAVPSDKQIDKQVVTEVLTTMVKQSDGEYRMIYEHLTKSQKAALKAIILFNGNGLFRLDALGQLNTSKQTLLAALKALMKNEMVDKEQGTYFITDKKFSLWCQLMFSKF